MARCVQPCTWGYGATLGAGFDYILPYAPLHNRLALRPIQADIEYSDINFGLNTAPTFFNGGVAKITAYRLSAGAVIRFGGSTEELPASYGCVVQPVTVFPGDPITVTGSVINLETGRKLKPVYTWETNGGQIEATDDVATISTADLARRRLHRHRPGQRRLPAHPARRVRRRLPHPGLRSAHHLLLGQPQQHPARRRLHHHLRGTQPAEPPAQLLLATTAGQIAGNKATGSLSAADVSPGIIDVTCNVVDDLGKSASSTTTVTVVAPPPPPAPAARTLCTISFDRDRKRPVRVDNEAKGCLDDIALEMNRESDATLVIVGKHGPEEAPETASERALNVRQYLTAEKGIDANRIELRTGESTGRSADNILVPPAPHGTPEAPPASTQPASPATASPTPPPPASPVSQKPGAPSSTRSFIARQAGGPGERSMLAGVECGVSFVVANDHPCRVPLCPSSRPERSAVEEPPHFAVTGCPILDAQFHRAAGRGPGERSMLAGVEGGVSFVVANDHPCKCPFVCHSRRESASSFALAPVFPEGAGAFRPLNAA